MIISVDTGKGTSKSQPSFMTETLRKLGTEGRFLNPMKDIHEKPTPNIMPHEGGLKELYLQFHK